MNKPIRVAHLDHAFAFGGAELALRRLANAASSWSPVVVIPTNTQGGPDVFEHGTVESVVIVRTSTRHSSGASRATFRVLFRTSFELISQTIALLVNPTVRSCDVVHTNTTRSALYGLFAARLLRKPIVVHLRDLIHRDAIGSFGYHSMRFVLRNANAVIANSRTTADSATPHLRKDVPVHVIHSPLGLIAPSRLAPEKRNSDKFRFGMVARLDPWKGQKLLIEAFAKTFPGSNYELHFAGGAPFGHDKYEAELRELVHSLSLTTQVFFHGHVDDVQRFIEGMNICVQASLRPEPLGQNILQYLILGKPVVAADQGGPAEWIDDGVNGLLFETGDVYSLGRQLKLLSENERLRNKIRAAARVTKDLYDDEKIADLHGLAFEAAALAREGGAQVRWRKKINNTAF